VGDTELYDYQNLNTDVTDVLAVKLKTLAKNSEAATMTMQHIIDPSGTSYETGQFTIDSIDTYEYASQIVAQNPETDADWTIDSVNILVGGFQIVSGA
jgi:hypothetical protein